MTKRQMEFMKFIVSYGKEYGTSPSYRELANLMGWVSMSLVFETVNILIREGFLAKTPNCARTLTVTEKGYDAMTFETVCPCCGSDLV